MPGDPLRTRAIALAQRRLPRGQRPIVLSGRLRRIRPELSLGRAGHWPLWVVLQSLSPHRMTDFRLPPKTDDRMRALGSAPKASKLGLSPSRKENHRKVQSQDGRLQSEPELVSGRPRLPVASSDFVTQFTIPTKVSKSCPLLNLVSSPIGSNWTRKAPSTKVEQGRQGGTVGVD
jgi:hypothetical protein